MRRFRDRENYDNFERDNFDRDMPNRDGGRGDRDSNNFDRIYDSREYSRGDDSRRFDEVNGGYSRPSSYAQDGYRYGEPSHILIHRVIIGKRDTLVMIQDRKAKVAMINIQGLCLKEQDLILLRTMKIRLFFLLRNLMKIFKNL